MKNKYSKTEPVSESTVLKIKVHPMEHKRMIFINGKTIIVTCVDDKEYKTQVHSSYDATEYKSLVEIYPSEWKKL